MKPEKLSDLKKELLNHNVHELTEICLRLAKYKKENKELLSYLLFDATEPMEYAEQVKNFLIDDFKSMQKHYFYSTKSLRKIIRLINRYAKYTGSKQVETELCMWFCSNYLIFADLRTSHKPLQGLLTRQFEKAAKLIPKLHEDLQFDYRQEFEIILNRAEKETRWINKRHFM
ncbi:hypothetical protein [Daejeonella sp. H1SJ63]|uniref:hypothetical protein n=1 Tax=Daejeonella sp. H1SJ63 TaxID=3034145 RepID=UPI0023EADA3E|nr:hypothetical protein [Daejeonella sp. H1SJ63]